MRNNLKKSQIDILIYDHHKHPTIYKDEIFVVVPPESVVAAVRRPFGGAAIVKAHHNYIRLKKDYAILV